MARISFWLLPEMSSPFEVDVTTGDATGQFGSTDR